MFGRRRQVANAVGTPRHRDGAATRRSSAPRPSATPFPGHPAPDAGAAGPGAGPPPHQPARPRPGLRQRVADLLDLPKDVVLDLPRVVAVGHLQVLVQNHRGLVEYTPERVVAALAVGRLVVSGEELRIGQVTAEELTVTGQIRAIEFAR